MKYFWFGLASLVTGALIAYFEPPGGYKPLWDAIQPIVTLAGGAVIGYFASERSVKLTLAANLDQKRLENTIQVQKDKHKAVCDLIAQIHECHRIAQDLRNQWSVVGSVTKTFQAHPSQQTASLLEAEKQKAYAYRSELHAAFSKAFAIAELYGELPESVKAKNRVLEDYIETWAYNLIDKAEEGKANPNSIVNIVNPLIDDLRLIAKCERREVDKFTTKYKELAETEEKQQFLELQIINEAKLAEISEGQTPVPQEDQPP